MQAAPGSEPGVGAERAEVDLAYGCPAEASSQESLEELPGFAVDGDPRTTWTSEYHDDQWLRIDLGEVRAIGRVAITWEAAYAQTYSLEGSVDGHTWKTLAEETGSEGVVTTRLPPSSQLCARSW